MPLRGWVITLVLALPLRAHAASAAADPGEILVGEMNCAACHSALEPIRERLASRQGPILGERGLRITPQWLRAFLQDPQAVAPGNVMPDSLHALPAAEKTAAADALTHYLLSLQKPDAAQGIYDAAVVAKGRELYHSVGCAACHAPQEMPAKSPDDQRSRNELQTAAERGVSLGKPEMKTTIPQMAAFLRDPLQTRPSGRMPGMKLDDAEATAIASYIQRAQAPAAGPVNTPGLAYEYYEEALPRLPRFERLTPKRKGIAAQMNLAPTEREDNVALRFRGNITIAAEGEYTFYAFSDDGTRLFIDDKEIIENDGIHAPKEVSARIVLKRGEHALMLVYFNGTGERALRMSWEGPNLPKQEIPASVLTHPGTPMVPTNAEAGFAVDPAKAERGRQLFASLNCAACHSNGASGSVLRLAAKPLAALDLARADSCIGPDTAPDRPKYKINATDRAAIQATLGAQDKLSLKLEPAAQVARTMESLNCYACHNRDGRGGPDGLKREYFATNGDVDLGDEGRIPPHLDGAGAKLRPEALAAILWQNAAARPYMATRMPQFGRENVQHLVPAFGADDPGPEVADLANVTNAAAFGRKLAGTGGLACITCHNFAGRPALGVPALDMTLMHDRLKPAWFRRYLIDPQGLRPGTRMPAFWPDGKALNRDILGGDTEQQIGALWQYLSAGKKAELPDGIVRGKIELSATKEALIYRNFIAGAGPRGIGVGFPERANLAWDADEMRIDLIWQGAFIDASRHRTGRGSGFEPPLGTNVVSWTPGAPLALLDGPEAPWPAGVGKTVGYQFRGYRLDPKQRPTFLYSFRGMQVEDNPVAVRGEVDAAFHRVLTVRAPAGQPPPERLFFRVAVGSKIETKESGVFRNDSSGLSEPNTYVIDGKVSVRLPGVQPPIIRRQGEKIELLAPVVFGSDNAARIEEEIVW